MLTPFVGKRLPSIRLMEADLSDNYASAGTDFLKKTAQFVPYTFKDLADVDLVEFSAMTSMNMLKYGTSGSTCVVGWHEVSVAFGASHGEAEEFRAIKINNKAFSQYKPQEFLPETMETNAQRKLVNGQPYEEISYYKDAASYGPTYYLMSIIAELFWCNGRSTRFTTPMVYAYMRSLATPEAWVSWVHMSKDGELDLKGLVNKFPTPIEDLKVIRESCKLTDNIPLAESVAGGPDGNAAVMTPKLTVRKRARDDKEPDRVVRTRVTTKGRSIVPAEAGPSAPASSPTESDSSGELVVFEPIFHDFGQKMGPVLADVLSKNLQASFGPLLVDAKAGQSLKKQLAELTTKLEESERGRTGLIGQVEALKRDLITCKEKATSELAASNGLRTQKELQQMKQESANAKSSIAKLETDLKLARNDVATRTAGEENLKAQIKSLTGQMEALKAKSTAKVAQLQQQQAVLQEQLQTEKLAVDRFKNAFNTEMQKNSDLDEQVVTLKAKIDSHKFSAERAEKAQSALRSELAKVKAELRMLQISAK
ncbi:hypothetical protein R1sor_021888 [Riccia sorocarpa]|uniref:Uncharacterized protein n=1 Tax=Riccia sorocarpa TaxID=122646 RepID=A0ABD3GI97_9MARC